jgi:hypothetical protein
LGTTWWGGLLHAIVCCLRALRSCSEIDRLIFAYLRDEAEVDHDVICLSHPPENLHITQVHVYVGCPLQNECRGASYVERNRRQHSWLNYPGSTCCGCTFFGNNWWGTEDWNPEQDSGIAILQEEGYGYTKAHHRSPIYFKTVTDYGWMTYKLALATTTTNTFISVWSCMWKMTLLQHVCTNWPSLCW